MPRARGRVVILSGVYPDMKCGVALHTWAVAQGLSLTERWDVHVLTSRHPDVDENLERSFELHPDVNNWSLRAMPEVARQIERLSPDILHIQYPTAAYCGRTGLAFPLLPLFARRTWNRTRVVATQHDLAIAHPLMQWKHGLLLRKAGAVTVSNDRDFQAVQRLSKRLAERTHVAHLASLFSPPSFPPDERASLRAKLSLPQDAFLLVYFGFIIPTRRIETLIRATALMMKRAHNVHLVLMGGTGPGAERYAERCRVLAEDLSAAARIHWTGYAPKEKVEKVLAVSDLFVSPIQRGADLRNSTILAAAAAGLPVLTTENSEYGIDRELRFWGFCRFFDPLNPQDLAEKLPALLNEPSTLRQMKQAALRFSNRYTWPEHVRILERAFRGDPPEHYDPEKAAGGLK